MDDRFGGAGDAIEQRVATGLAKIGLVLRHQAWQDAAGRGLTPTQQQILGLLRHRDEIGLRPSEVAAELGVSLPTASDAIQALARKGLLQKRPAPDDGRGRVLTLTGPGRQAADAATLWPDALLAAIDELSPAEQRVFLRGLIKMIRSLQVRGQIPVARMCVSCRFFRPHVHADPLRPHHCAFVDAPFGDLQLRLDCPDFAVVAPDYGDRVWERFVAGGEETPPA